MKSSALLLITLFISLFHFAFADTAKKKLPKSISQPSNDAPPEFTGNISAGGTLNTGNSTAYNFNSGITLNYNKKKWVNSFNFQSQIGGDRESGLNSRNYNVQAQTKYFFLPPTCYLYGLTNYTLDSFSTYKVVLTGSIGYGKRIINRSNMSLDLQIGPSYTRRRVAGHNGPVESYMGAFTSASYLWNISDDIQFNQTLSINYDSNNTATDAVTSLSSTVMQDIALKLSYEFKNNTRIPPESSDTSKTDTITTISVVYSF